MSTSSATTGTRFPATAAPNICRTEVCGNGLTDTGEQCDDGNTISGDGCSANCTIERCGNGIVDQGEECDDGNLVNGDGCSSICKTEACGNGIIGDRRGVRRRQQQRRRRLLPLPARWSAAATGFWTPASSATTATSARRWLLPAVHRSSSCGNGIVDAGEQCDDGNAVPGDGCDANCLLEAATCGDGVVRPAWRAVRRRQHHQRRRLLEYCRIEQLRRRHRAWTSASSATTATPISGDGCSATCQLERCGDGVVDPGEQCDDGNTDLDGDGCSSTASDEPAGDGILEHRARSATTATSIQRRLLQHLQSRRSAATASSTRRRAVRRRQPRERRRLRSTSASSSGCAATASSSRGEQCDDGNTVAGDGCSDHLHCSSTAATASVETWARQCDDGNTVGGDGCSATCRDRGLRQRHRGSRASSATTATVPGDGCSSNCRWDDLRQRHRGAGRAVRRRQHRHRRRLLGHLPAPESAATASSTPGSSATTATTSRRRLHAPLHGRALRQRHG